MIQYLRGVIAGSFDGGIIVEVGGIGYKVFVPDNSPLYTEKGKEAIKVHTVMVVREDDVSIYGFHNNDSLDLFQMLRTVNGIGAKVALSILSSIAASEIRNAIAFEDANALTKAAGVGKKTAQRIVLELKDKIGVYEGAEEYIQAGGKENERTEAVNALIGLGYTRSEAISAVGAIKAEELSTEEYIRRALKATPR